MGIIESGYVSLNKYGEELCGDCVEVTKRSDSVTMVLADGLGSGVKANILATLTSKILGTMMANGLKIEDAVQTVAQTLPVCSVRKIAYSTFSVLQVSPDGKAYLVQYDNPQAILIRGTKVVDFPKNELDIGGKRIFESRISLSPGDMFLLISDGIVHAGAGRVYNMEWRWEQVSDFVEEHFTPEITAKGMASLLAGACRQLTLDEPADDATVAALRLRETQTASVMIGPPADEKNGGKMVEALMNQKGLKAVCGGTTSQIVADFLHRDIVTQAETAADGIPPISSIQGIDLVTEGVLTFGKALEYVEANETPFEESPAFVNGVDGAARLARLLLNQCTSVRFIVGTAVNPAYNSPEFPSSLSRKTALVEKMAKSLQRGGKSVSIQYF